MNKVLLQKALIISALVCVILVTLLFVDGVISDREKYRDQAVRAIEASYAGPQVLIGPVLVRPYTQTVESVVTSDSGVKKLTSHKQELVATSYPRQLNVHGVMLPSERRHGLYKVEVYEFQGEAQESFDIVDPHTEGNVVWGEPYLALYLSDVRGIVGRPRVLVNGVDVVVMQGAPETGGWAPNLHVPLSGASALKGHMDVSLKLEVGGTGTFAVAPIGDANLVDIRSDWASPLFAGQFLPRSREVSKSGFHAVWDVSSLASGAQVQIENKPAKAVDVMSVSLTTLVDPYTLSSRALKYGILFVILTFAGFLIFELMKHLSIHPVQYLLVGFGLAIFFLLLVSFSEHVAFGLAYIIASAACIALLTFYLSFVLKSVQRGLTFGAILSALYSAIYGLLFSEDNALILGSLLLFALLAVVMFITRRVNWSKGISERGRDGQPSAAPPPLPS